MCGKCCTSTCWRSPLWGLTLMPHLARRSRNFLDYDHRVELIILPRLSFVVVRTGYILVSPHLHKSGCSLHESAWYDLASFWRGASQAIPVILMGRIRAFLLLVSHTVQPYPVLSFYPFPVEYYPFRLSVKSMVQMAKVGSDTASWVRGNGEQSFAHWLVFLLVSSMSGGPVSPCPPRRKVKSAVTRVSETESISFNGTFINQNTAHHQNQRWLASHPY